MQTLGRHVLVEYEGCDPNVLDNEETIRSILLGGIKAAGATLVTLLVSRSKQGIDAVAVVQESHLSIHTHLDGRVTADFYTCGECKPEAACPVLAKGLHAEQYQFQILDRGYLEGLPIRQVVPPTIVNCGG